MAYVAVILRDFDAEHRVVTYWTHVAPNPVQVAMDDDSAELNDSILDLYGKVGPNGVWDWNGLGDPRDDLGNTIMRVECYSDSDYYAALEEERETEAHGPRVDLPEELTAWSVLPEDQGQTVEVAYAVDWSCEPATLWRRDTDGACKPGDRNRVMYFRVGIYGGEFEPQNGVLPECWDFRRVRVRETK